MHFSFGVFERLICTRKKGKEGCLFLEGREVRALRFYFGHMQPLYWVRGGILIAFVVKERDMGLWITVIETLRSSRGGYCRHYILICLLYKETLYNAALYKEVLYTRNEKFFYQRYAMQYV